MKYTNSVIIDKPIDQVIALFDNFENMKKWQPDLQSYEHLEGVSGQPGAKTKLTYLHGKRKTEMIETIVVRNLPEEFSGTYEMKSITNHMHNSFKEIENGKTEWVSHTEFIFSGFMKIMAFFMGWSFKKMSQKMMYQFKDFAEGQ